MSTLNYKEMNNAYSEVYEILQNTDQELVNKIPKSYLEVIKNNRNLDYKFIYDKSKSPKEQKILKETKNILGLIYLKYWAEDDERRKITSVLRKNHQVELEKQKEEYYKKH